MEKTKKNKRYSILGGIKVSSRKLSEWGSYGGRPRKYGSREEKLEARRVQRAIRIGKDPATLRSYKSVVETKTKTIQIGRVIYNDPETKQFPQAFSGQCNKCGSEVYGSPKTQGEQCQSCHQGTYEIKVITTTTTTKRAMSSAERVRKYRERVKQLQNQMDKREEEKD
jgi:hypothetical protein